LFVIRVFYLYCYATVDLPPSTPITCPVTQELSSVIKNFDSASLAKFLITDESSWVTGQVIGVDGGRSTVA
jgi:NAD(P)-dependent dehydrogenase (short-subunit alcohol dehydrogenase family)